eukprot:jgi/Picsp_1/5665/NSC_03024-R1_---NA---
MCDVHIPKKYKSALISWARDKAFRNNIFPRRKSSSPHPEKPGEMANLGSWINHVITKARGKVNARNKLDYQSQYIEIANRIREILIKEYKQQGQHNRAKKLSDDWWKGAKEGTEYQPREESFPSRGTSKQSAEHGVSDYQGHMPHSQHKMKHDYPIRTQGTIIVRNHENDSNEKCSVLPSTYAACLRVWSRIDQFKHHPYPLNGTARAIPTPDDPHVGWNLGKWVNKVLRRARGEGRAKGDQPLQHAYQHVAQAVLELLTGEYSLQHQRDRIASLHRSWSHDLNPNVALLPSNGARQESVIPGKPMKRPRDASLQLEQEVHHGPPTSRRRKISVPKRCE